MYIIGHLDQGSDDVAKLLYLYRQQDVRATEIDKVDMHLSFRPGDIIRAVVVSFTLDRPLYWLVRDFEVLYHLLHFVVGGGAKGGVWYRFPYFGFDYYDWNGTNNLENATISLLSLWL